MITLLAPAQYRRIPWKNGGGTTTDIAVDNESDGNIWRFGRTPIPVAGPFSDYSGYDRVQVLVVGHGLVLETPKGEIDVREPFRPVRFAGETTIVSRLEGGPVEVVNLIGLRAQVRIDLQVLSSGSTAEIANGLYFAYSPLAASRVTTGHETSGVPVDHCLRIDAGSPTMLACDSGQVLLASIT